MPTRDIVVGAQNSAILYAGLEGGGVYKSTDSGANWSQASTQPANKRVMALAQDPSKYSRLYAATYGGGMFVSTDNAATWAACAGAHTQPESRIPRRGPGRENIRRRRIQQRRRRLYERGSLQYLGITFHQLNRKGDSMRHPTPLVSAATPHWAAPVWCFLAATATYAGDDAFSGQRLVSGSGTTLGYYALAVKPSDVNVVYAGGSRVPSCWH